MSTIKLTSKRQATLPKALCDDMGLAPGDSIAVERREVEGAAVWVLLPQRAERPPWFGSLAKYAKGKRHDMRSVRRSVEEARRGGE